MYYIIYPYEYEKINGCSLLKVIEWKLHCIINFDVYNLLTIVIIIVIIAIKQKNYICNKKVIFVVGRSNGD